MIKDRRNFIAIIIILVFGSGLFYLGTDGFKAYTADTARTKQLIEERPDFPLVSLEDSKERVYPFSEFQGKYVMITFIYTACSGVCPQLEMNLVDVYNYVTEKYDGMVIIFFYIIIDYS